MDERLRALRQASELLQAMATSGELAPAIRDLAASALQRYPGDAEIEGQLEGVDPSQVLAWGEALATTRTLVDGLRRRAPAADRWRAWAIGVDRHLPEASYLPGHPRAPSPWSATFLDPMKPF
ncbi:MAG TPA: BPSL0761 family protein, partial [Roseateles sp.]|nr:BPSL0761 family protein [Roseateles sp.]